MYVKSIVLDGFKSYGQRTEINGFDKLFNAITGLNGSGKSNILDAICFVLGLQNMSLARCTNLRELIYKNGTAGVVKASVTITFDNKNKEQCPAGYDQYDEIIIRREVQLNGRTKYWINGYLAQKQSQVTDLFHSVHLNIANPHFLIMQGRITKVLNMKPQEILSMVEETIGISHYEIKKKQAVLMIEKKDSALRNIDSLINETIVPKFEQLKKEQSGLIEFQNVSKQLEHLSNVSIAFRFRLEEENCKKASSNIDEKRNKIDYLKRGIREAEGKTEEITKLIADLEKKKDVELGGRLTELEEILKGEQMNDAKLVSQLNNQNDHFKEINKKMLQLNKNLEGDVRITKSKEIEYEKVKKLFDSCQQKNSTQEDELKKAERDFEAVSAGLSKAGDGEAAATLADQLMQAKNEIASANTETKKAQMSLKHFKAELHKKENEAKKQQNTQAHDTKEIDAVNNTVASLRNKLNALHFDEPRHSELSKNSGHLRSQIEKLKEQISFCENKNYNLKFEYRDPVPNFDRKKVIGMLCQLFKIKNPEHFYAIEKVVGGKLFNVVVDNEETGKLILDKGQLKQRRTLLPLTKIHGRQVDIQDVRKAEKLVGKGNVFSAISLVEYNHSLEQAMRYAFGDTLVCLNMEMGKELVRKVNKRVVTLDGEVFDPAGTLSGGAREKGPQILALVNELLEKREEMKNLMYQLETVDNELSQLNVVFKEYSQLKRQFEIKEREAELVKQRLEQGNYHQLLQEVDEIKKTIKEHEETLVKCEGIKRKADGKVKELEIKLKDTKATREREQKEAEQNLIKKRKEVESSRKSLNQHKSTYESLELEIDSLKKSVAACEEQLKELEIEKSKVEEEISKIQDELKHSKKKVAAADDDVKKYKKMLKNHSDEIVKQQKEREKTVKLIEDNNLQIKQVDHEINKIENDSKESAKNRKLLARKYPWLIEENSLDVQIAGYDFNNPNFNPSELNKKIESLKTTKNQLSKTVNMRANIMLSDKEKEAEELRKKRKIISNDRNNLIQYMEEVDQKKKNEIKQAWEKISGYFGSIFSTFLPNSDAKLEPQQGKTIYDGLEVKIALGDVWKESLTELSGGQRSLVALSLILALLKYTPAPLYILDEVDAALDQSHTQNTGLMIRNHFKNSQFIIVSLKDDMFNNANVLYKTKFVEGNSTVTRITRQDK